MTIPDDLITCQQLTPMAIVLYITLKKYASRGVVKDISIEAMGLYRSSFIRHIDSLVRLGFVSVDKRIGKGNTNIYRIIK